MSSVTIIGLSGPTIPINNNALLTSAFFSRSAPVLAGLVSEVLSMGCVYQARNKTNGKRYVGKTVGTMEDRRQEHEKSAREGIQTYFHCALRKYGFDFFEWEKLHSDVCREDLDRLEIECIAHFGTKVPEGYNLTDGGEGSTGFTRPKSAIEKTSIANRGRKASLEARKKMSAWQRGRKLSLEHRAKLSRVAKGKKKSAATRAKMSLAQLGHGCSKETRAKISCSNKGQTVSPEHRAKISKALTGKTVSKETREKLRLASTGKHPTLEARIKMSLAKKGKSPWNKGIHKQ